MRSETAEIVEAIEGMVIWQPPFMRGTDPWFRFWDRAPRAALEKFKGLRSDDLRDIRPDYVRKWIFTETK